LYVLIAKVYVLLQPFDYKDIFACKTTVYSTVRFGKTQVISPNASNARGASHN
jgi:hypothetical protein